MQVDDRSWEPVWEPVLRKAAAASVDFEYPDITNDDLIVFDNISVMNDTGAATDFVTFVRIGEINYRVDYVTGIAVDTPRNYTGRIYADRNHKVIVRALNAAATELLRCLFMGRRYKKNKVIKDLQSFK